MKIAPVVLTGLTIEQQVATLRETATKLAEDLATHFPNEAEAHMLLADTHRRFGRSAEAVDCWQKALQLDPRLASLYDRMAIVAMEKGQFEEALTLWRQALAIDPALPGVCDKMGRVFLASGQQDEAITALTDAVRIAPTSAPTYYLLGQAYLQKNLYESAVAYYQKALELDPGLRNAYYGLATAYARLRQPALAKKYQTTFRELSADDSEGRPYGFSAEDDLSKARADYLNAALRGATLLQAKGQSSTGEALLQQAVAVDPNQAAPRKRLAACYRSAGKLPQALAQCEQIARLEPNDPTCQLLIGALSLELTQPVRAEAAFRRITALVPNQSVGYHELARLYLETGKGAAEARRLAEKAVTLEPNAANYFLLGQACYQAGDTKAALSAVNKAIQLDPRNSSYQQAYNMMKMRR
jgi:tetratricopeptide (TPR) repeat protein